MEELERTIGYYEVVSSYDLEFSHKGYYEVIPGYDLCSGEKGYYEISFSIPNSGFPKIKGYYEVIDSFKTTTPAGDGGNIESYTEYFASFNPSLYIENGYQERLIKAPLPEEYYSRFRIRAFIQVPELSPSEIEIPQKYLIAPYCKSAINGGVKWNLTLDNWNREFTDPNNAIFGGLFKEGKYSPRRETRKYLRLKYQSVYADKLTGIILDFPRLVITDRTPPGKKITISGRDEITEYLFNKIDLVSYCVEETLLPVSSSKETIDGEDYYTQFQSSTLTKPDYISGFTKILVNGEQAYLKGISFSYNSSNKRYISNRKINGRFPVMVQQPISCHEIIKDICKKIVDKDQSEWNKDYFPVILDFPDYLVRANVTCENEEGIKIIQKLTEVVPAEWLIEVINGVLTLLIRKKPIDYEKPDVAKYILKERILRGEPEESSSNVLRINKKVVQRYSRLITVEEEVI